MYKMQSTNQPINVAWHKQKKERKKTLTGTGACLLWRYPWCWSFGALKERCFSRPLNFNDLIPALSIFGPLQLHHRNKYSTGLYSIRSPLLSRVVRLTADCQQLSATAEDCTENSGQTRGAQGEPPSTADSEDVTHTHSGV